MRPLRDQGALPDVRGSAGACAHAAGDFWLPFAQGWRSRKSWYKKIFKKDVPLNEDDGGQSLLDRFEVDFGAVDPKTGRNETTAQVRLTDRFFLIGDLEMGGGFSGRVKYVLKFK